MQKIEENNRIGKTRDLFKKIRDTKGTFHAKMGSIKDRKSTDLTVSFWQGSFFLFHSCTVEEKIHGKLED